MSDLIQPRKDLREKTLERNLSKQEIVDILKRNVELYQNEPDFARYLAEMAVYLVQYRYDPKKTAPERAASGHVDTAGGSVIYALSEKFRAKRKSQMMCAYCGAEKKRSGVCPACGL